jgi:hypothetical protein
MPEGQMTLSKLDATMSKIMSIEGTLEGYVQYPGSDCRNGAVLKVSNGDRLMNRVYSHHYCLMTGHRGIEIDLLSKVFGFELESI